MHVVLVVLQLGIFLSSYKKLWTKRDHKKTVYAAKTDNQKSNPVVVIVVKYLAKLLNCESA